MNIESKKILIIDDDKTLLDILFQLLTRLDYEVVCADNGYSGLDLFLKGQFDAEKFRRSRDRKSLL